MNPIPLATQRDLYAQHAEAAYSDLYALLIRHRGNIIASGLERLTTVGYREYASQSWRRDPVELLEATIEELADAVVYLVMRRAQQPTEGAQ